MKKVVVTGGAGFIGSHLVDALITKGYEVHVIDDLSGGKKENINPKAIFHKEDTRNAEAIEQIISGATYVFHLAAIPSIPRSIDEPVLTHDVNVNGMLNVLVAATKAKVEKFIYSASSSAYGDEPTLPHVETMTADPKSPYGLHKYIGECYSKVWNNSYGLPTVNLRYFNVYGPRQSGEGSYASVIATFLTLKKENKTLRIVGDGEQTRDFVHVRDVVQANIKAAESSNVGKGEVINIASGKQVSVNQIAAIIGGPIEHIQARPETKHSRADITKAKTLLDWQPTVVFEEGVEELKNI